LCDAALGPEGDEPVRSLFVNPLAYDGWAKRWRERLALEPQDASSCRTAMRAVNPAFIPRNHRVEAAITAAVERDDFSLFDEMLAVLATPYEDQPRYAHYAEPPEPHEVVHQTFCGT
jgi:uncharacterized protein YdiU (UPF0061 family)